MSNVRLLVLGLGNVLLEDDGVGCAALALLRERFIAPEGVQFSDGGTLGLSLLPYLEDAESVLLVDAIRAEGSPAGTLVRLEGDDVAPAVATRLSVHQIGVSDLLEGARWLDRYPAKVVLLGLVPESMELSVGLSPRVAAGLEALVAAVAGEVRAQGFALEPRLAPPSQRGQTPLWEMTILQPTAAEGRP